ncbi:hypothetical protein [Pseudoalteromonas sp. SaAl2]
MNVVKLSPNWTLQIAKVIFALLVAYILSAITAFGFESASVIIIPLVLVISLFNIMQLRFLHCYKAGVNYSRGLGKRYINADEIKSISFKRYGIITEFKIVTLAEQSHRFINWHISADQRTGIKNLYAAKYVGCDNNNTQSCNA